MFDIGLTEIIVVIIVASVMLDIKDLPKIIKVVKQIIQYLNEIIADVKKIYTDIEQETNKIIDLDGNEQVTYDLSDIMPDIKEAKKPIDPSFEASVKLSTKRTRTSKIKKDKVDK